MQRFTNPKDIYHGKGVLEALKTFEGKKAVILPKLRTKAHFCAVSSTSEIIS